MDPKIFKAKCSNLLRDYEDVLNEILEEEEKKFKTGDLGNSFFQIAKDTIFHSGMRQGLRRFIARINDIAHGEE